MPRKVSKLSKRQGNEWKKSQSNNFKWTEKNGEKYLFASDMRKILYNVVCVLNALNHETLYNILPLIMQNKHCGAAKEQKSPLIDGDLMWKTAIDECVSWVGRSLERSYLFNTENYTIIHHKINYKWENAVFCAVAKNSTLNNPPTTMFTSKINTMINGFSMMFGNAFYDGKSPNSPLLNERESFCCQFFAIKNRG